MRKIDQKKHSDAKVFTEYKSEITNCLQFFEFIVRILEKLFVK